METTIPTRQLPAAKESVGLKPYRDTTVASAKEIAEKAIHDPDPENTSKLLAFAEEQIEKMKNAASLGNVDGQPGFYELNKALADYQTVNLGLLSIYAVAKTEYAAAVEAFEDWYSDKYILVRDEMNPRSLTPTKWYGAKEIEMQVRVRFKDDFHFYERAKVEADQKISIIRRLLDSWASQHFVLGRLCKNIEAEMVGEGTREGF